MEHYFSVFTDKANLLGATVVAVLGGVFGAHWQVFVLFFALNVVDFSMAGSKASRPARSTVRKVQSAL
ncbi:MAG: hypothetical protein ACLR4Z_08130 [Butyricicoccaceae bacterium]